MSREVTPQRCVGRGQGGLPIIQGAVEQGQWVEALENKEKSAQRPLGQTLPAAIAQKTLPHCPLLLLILDSTQRV